MSRPVLRPVPVSVVVMAKRPRPGAVKTRLCPPCTPAQAADLAGAALADTIANVQAAAVRDRVIAIDEPGAFTAPAGFRVIGQACGSLDVRLAAAAGAVGGPVLIVGMDTPQAGAALIEHAATRLVSPGADAVLGPAADGGYWAIGLRAPRARHFVGVPMSCEDTGRAQLARLREHGLRVELLDVLRDVDDFGDARVVAASVPGSCFARAVERLGIPA